MSQPKVGVGILVIRDRQILLGERIYSHGKNTWCPPGGHLEFGETIEECAYRELEEETGIKALEITPGPWTNDLYEREQKHYVTIFTIVLQFDGEPKVMEPKKCRKWQWFSFDVLPSPLFPSVENLLIKTPLDKLHS